MNFLTKLVNRLIKDKELGSCSGGKFRWSKQLHGIERIAYFLPKFKNQLREEKWLFDEDGKKVSPNEISISDLSADYFTYKKYFDDPKENFIVLLEKEILAFQTDALKKHIFKFGGKYIPPNKVSSYERFEAWEKQQEAKNESKEESGDLEAHELESKTNIDEVETSISNVTPELLIRKDLSYQNIDRHRNVKKYNNKENVDDVDENAGIQRKETGRRGEEIVFKHFKGKEYPGLKNCQDTELGFIGKDESNNTIEVKWLNKNDDVGEGYDFVILKNDVEIEYIEVKSSSESGKALHRITGNQWEYARHLFDEGDGEKYKIFVVKDVYSVKLPPIDKLTNPIKLWKEGRLFARAINFEL